YYHVGLRGFHSYVNYCIQPLRREIRKRITRSGWTTEYIPPKDEVFLAEEQPLPAAASPTTDSPVYILESDPNEDPEDEDDEDSEEDPADYLADHDDEEEEEEEDPSGDDADEVDEEQDEDDDDEEEEEEPSGDDANKEDEDDDDEKEEHPASADSIPPLPALRVMARISSRPQLPILFFTKEDAERADRPEVTLPPRKRADYGFVDFVETEIRRWIAEDIGYGIRDTWIDPRDVAEEEAWTTLEGVNTRKMAPKRAAPRRTTMLNLGATSNLNQAPSTTTTTVTNAQLQAMIDQGVNVLLAARDANRTRDDSHTSGTGVRSTERVNRECTYQDFIKCQPLYFKGALTWWNSHVRIVDTDAAYVMTWIELKKKMADKYCPRNKMKKIETELWNMEVQGIDLTRYNQRF
nr:hypothetical protein [Tanacetum cinerariifolium]